MKTDNFMNPHFKFMKIAFLSVFLLIGVFSVGVGEARGDTYVDCFWTGHPTFWTLCTQFTLNTDKSSYVQGEPVIVSGSAQNQACANWSTNMNTKVSIDRLESPVPLWPDDGVFRKGASGSITFNKTLSVGTHNAISDNNFKTKWDPGRYVEMKVPFTVVAPPPPPPPPPVVTPTVTLTPSQTSVTAGTPVNLTWTSTNTSSCTATASGTGPGNWTGPKTSNSTSIVDSHTESTGLLNTAGDQTYNITCNVAGAVPSAQGTPIIFDYATASNGQTSANGQYTWTVPAGVASVKVKAWGGGGSVIRSVWPEHNIYGGGGGFAETIVSVSAGQVINIAVGKKGTVFPALTTIDRGCCAGKGSVVSRSSSILLAAGGGGIGTGEDQMFDSNGRPVIDGNGGPGGVVVSNNPLITYDAIGYDPSSGPVTGGVASPYPTNGGSTYIPIGGSSFSNQGTLNTPGNTSDAYYAISIGGGAIKLSTDISQYAEGMNGRIVLIPQNGTTVVPVVPTVSATTTVTVTAPPAPTASCTVDNSSPIIGTNADFVISFTGGTAPYTSSLTFDGTPIPATGNTIGATFSPSTPNPYTSNGFTVHIPMTTAGTHQLVGQVVDANSVTTTFNCRSSVDPTIIVVNPVLPLRASCRLTLPLPTASSPIATWTATATGGLRPYTWPDGTHLDTYSYSHDASTVHTPSFSVRDSNLRTASPTPSCPPASVSVMANPTLRGVPQVSSRYTGPLQAGTMSVNRNQKFKVVWDLNSAIGCQLNANPLDNVTSQKGKLDPTDATNYLGGLTSSSDLSDILISGDTVFTLNSCKDLGGNDVNPAPTLNVNLKKGATVIEQ